MIHLVKNTLLIVLLSASVAVGASTVSVEVDTQRAGGDYTNYPTNSPRQCANDCARDRRCLAFDFSRHDRQCWLKSYVPGARFNRDVVSGVKNMNGPANDGNARWVGNMRIEKDTQRAFGDYTNFVVPDPQACARRCSRDSRCLAFEYGRADRRCWLKNTVPAARYNRDVISGVKEWHPQRKVRRKIDARVETAQGILRMQGYHPGPSDGVAGYKTRLALKQFQRDNGLPISGTLDDATYKLLLKYAEGRVED